jgi:hypothetical protein
MRQKKHGLQIKEKKITGVAVQRKKKELQTGRHCFCFLIYIKIG